MQRRGSPEAERLPGPCPVDPRFSRGQAGLHLRSISLFAAVCCTHRLDFSRRHFQPGPPWQLPSLTLPECTSSSGRPEPHTSFCRLSCEVPGASRRRYPPVPGTEAVWENGPRAWVSGLPAARHPLGSCSAAEAEGSVP